MHIAYYKEYSHNLGRDMEFKVYGHAGKPCLVFPAQDGRFFDFENFKMVDAASWYLENGLIQFFCIDSLDKETWSSKGDQSWRIERHEAWYRYICDELMPRIYQIHNETAQENYTGKVMTTGCSMGAYHALNFMLRRPDIFDGVLALSGLYHAGYFFENYTDGRIYENSPCDFMANMPWNHHYLEAYRKSKIILVVGQGMWEKEAIEDTRIMQQHFERLQVPAWCDFWGYDVNHDWPWWLIQLPHFLQYFVRKEGE